MEKQRQTESVLAKLMGIDGPLPIKQIHCGRQRVLSESYLLDIASICQRKNWSFDHYSMDIETVDKEDSSEEMRSSSSSEEFLERYGKEAEKVFWLLNTFQKVDKDYTLFGPSYSPNLLESPKEMESFAHVPLKSVLRDENIGIFNNSSTLRKKGIYSGRKEKDRLRYRREALGHGSTVSNGVAKQVANQLQKSVWHDSLNAFGCGNTSKSEIVNAQTQSISNSTSVPLTSNSKSRNRTFSVHEDWCLDLVNGGGSYCNSLQELSGQSEDITRRDSTSIGSVGEKETHLISCDLTEFGKNGLLEEISNFSDAESVGNKAGERVFDELFDMLQEIGTCGNKECLKFDASAEQVADDTWTPLHGSSYKSKSTSSDVRLLPSPVLDVDLQQPVPQFFEPEAERNIRSKKMGFDTKDLIFGTNKIKETHDSYLVDVLAELGLRSGNTELTCKLGQPLESLIDTSVFETLEKKYGEQRCFPKSERKLLFDRIKGVLSDISTRRQCRMKRHAIQYNLETIKEYLLAALASQEKEAGKESSQKMDGLETDCLELEEEEQIIAMEIEAVLLDELVEEMISTGL